MIDATRMRSGCACLIRASRGSHQSSGLSEMSSQFQDECSADPGRFCIVIWYESAVARRNLVFGPATFATGWRPMVFVTTPPQPASKARMMLLSDSVGGAEDSRNGFSNLSPVNVTDRSAAMDPPLWEILDYTARDDFRRGTVNGQRRHTCPTRSRFSTRNFTVGSTLDRPFRA